MDNTLRFQAGSKIDSEVYVSKYLDELSNTDDTELKNLAESMSAYGDAANAYFSGETVAEQTGTADLSKYQFTEGTMPEGISYYGSSLILESETTIRHYFTLDEGIDISDCTFTVDGTSVTPEKNRVITTLILRQYRTKTVRKMRSQIFCQMKQKTQLILCVSTRLFVKYDGKYASRLRAESQDVLCAVLP